MAKAALLAPVTASEGIHDTAVTRDSIRRFARSAATSNSWTMPRREVGRALGLGAAVSRISSIASGIVIPIGMKQMAM